MSEPLEVGLSLRALLKAATAVCALSLTLTQTACSDGYPTQDVPQVDPAQMTQAQLLAALNELGDEPHLGKRWRYALQADCELAISVRNGDTQRFRIALEGAEVATRSVDGVSEIRLVPGAGEETQAVTVLETRTWSDTILAKSLLTHLEVRCGEPAAPGAAAS